MVLPIVGVSLKMYFTRAQTRAWLSEVAAVARDDDWRNRVETFVLPDFLSLEAAGPLLAGSGVGHGAQDVFWEPAGPFTGEVSSAALAEVGCRYVAVGHAERRRLFGEDDTITARKALAGARAGLTPIVCIGETTMTSPADAATACIKQIDPVLGAIDAADRLVFAYEPVWAIGRASPAEPSFIVDVATRIRTALSTRLDTTSLIYGGSAGRGLISSLWPAVDGLFLGRFAHDISDLRAVVAEVQAAAAAESRR